MTKGIERTDVLVVGAGPAGASTALHLASLDPTWARRIVLIDAAVHPRDKLCGGGVTHLGERLLRRMGLAFEPDHIAIREVELRWGDRCVRFLGDPVMRITRRRTFDAWLVAQVRRAGVRVREGEPVQSVALRGDRVEVITDQATFQARVVVGADGSRSRVRRALGGSNGAHLARLLEVLTPPTPAEAGWFDPEGGRARFDLGVRDRGVAGYAWDFPARIDGTPWISRGLFDLGAGPRGAARGEARVHLPDALRTIAADRGVDPRDLSALHAHPIRTFDPAAPLATERILLAGDAAGVDPLFGEGISFALAYGEVGAAEIARAFARRDFSFRGYRQAVLRHPLLGQLPARVRLARLGAGLANPLAAALGMRLLGAALHLTRWHDPEHDPAAVRHALLRA